MKKLLVVLVGLAMAAPAMADDVLAPPWQGEVSTTLQWWEFATNLADDVLPDGPGPLVEDPYTPGYLPSTKITHIEPDPANPTWLFEDPFGSPRTGIWPLSGTMDVIVDNHNPPNDRKLVWVQITWHASNMQHPDTPHLVNLHPSASFGPIVVDEILWCNDWYTTVFYWEIEPNPVDEMFRIQGDIMVDQLVIDTWCMPEPATLGLMALGGLGLIFRKRR